MRDQACNIKHELYTRRKSSSLCDSRMCLSQIIDDGSGSYLGLTAANPLT